MLTKSEFLASVKGKQIDVDGVPKSQPYQCVDLVKYYMKKCYGIPYFSINNAAKNLYNQFSSFKYLVENFDKLPYKNGMQLKKGDIAVWGNGQFGHTAVISRNTTSTSCFYSYDQNYGTYFVKEIKHDYTGFLGVLRPKKAVTTANLNVRAGAGTLFAKVDELDKGTVVDVLGTKGNWTQIGVNRYVATKYLD